MRWVLLVMMVCGSLALMGKSCESSTGGNGGDGGDGSAGQPGTGGDAGMGGTGGTGGSPTASDCGFLTTCEPGVGDSCDEYCIDVECGSEDNLNGANCLDDGGCWCWCVQGSCSDDDCIETGDCSFDDPDETVCENQCMQICDGPGDVREAYCDGSGDVTGYCKCTCNVGGTVSCSEDF